MALTSAEKTARYRARHPDRVKREKASPTAKARRVVYNRQWRENNRDRWREYKRSYYHNDPNKKVRNVMTGMRRRYGKGLHWKSFQDHVLRFNGCFWCNSEWAEIHHLVPISMGGDNSLRNLVPLCDRCHIHAHRAVKP